LPQWQQERFGALYNDFFYHRHDEFWRRNAERKLPELLSASGMLACGEDLGMVPDCVPGVMDHWKILSLEMVQMDKGRPWPYLSVCATSSHDMATLRMQNAEAGKGDLAPWDLRRILWDHLSSASMLAIFPLQDWVGLDADLRRPDFENERINQPADPNHHWRYRFHLPLSVLNSEKASELRVQIEGLVRDSNRYLG
jgi:4-alpha-glucanotransferase